MGKEKKTKKETWRDEKRKKKREQNTEEEKSKKERQMRRRLFKRNLGQSIFFQYLVIRKLDMVDLKVAHQK